MEKNPNILGYPVRPSERGKSAVELYYQALKHVSLEILSAVCGCVKGGKGLVRGQGGDIMINHPPDCLLLPLIAQPQARMGAQPNQMTGLVSHSL